MVGRAYCLSGAEELRHFGIKSQSPALIAVEPSLSER